MGARYYNPVQGRFLSPDPIGYPLQLDLYAYANNNPMGYHDPDGRFSCPHYAEQKQPQPFFQKLWDSPRTAGILDASSGAIEAIVGRGLALAPHPACKIIGGFLVVHGTDRVATKVKQQFFCKI